MTLETQWQLTHDDGFVSRCRACLTQQSDAWKADARPDVAALAHSILKSDPAPIISFQNLLGASPGFAGTVDNGDGTINSAKITDGDILAAVQNEYPTVASLYFTSTGTPIT